MAVNDFWKRIAHETAGEGGGIQPIATTLVHAVMFLVAFGGSFSDEDSKDMMSLAVGNERSEMQDLINSAITINTPAPGFGDRVNKITLADTIAHACHLAQNADADIPGNPFFHNGEAVRQLIKQAITDLGGTPAGTLAA